MFKAMARFGGRVIPGMCHARHTEDEQDADRVERLERMLAEESSDDTETVAAEDDTGLIAVRFPDDGDRGPQTTV